MSQGSIEQSNENKIQKALQIVSTDQKGQKESSKQVLLILGNKSQLSQDASQEFSLTEQLKDNKKQQITKQESKSKAGKQKMGGFTQQELKLMKKKALKYDSLKSQYDKLLVHYQVVKKQREELISYNQKNKEINQNLKAQNQRLQLKIQTYKEQGQKLRLQVQQSEIVTQIGNKKLEQLKRKVQQSQILTQKNRQLSLIIDMTTKDLQQQKKLQEKSKLQLQKYRQLLKYQKETNNNVKIQLDKLRLTEKETFTYKQELVRISIQYEQLKKQKAEYPIMIDKFQHQERIINELKNKIIQNQKNITSISNINQKLQKRINKLNEQKKEAQQEVTKIRCELQEMIGQNQVLKVELQEERGQWQTQRKKYLNEIKTFKTQLHNQHEKLKITEWQLSESKKKERSIIKLERVNVMSLSKQDLLNYIQQMEMKNQSLRLNLDHTSIIMQEKDKRIKEQQASIMCLVREITKDFPNYDESEGMEYVQKEIIQIGKSKKTDWGQIVEKVMIENLRLKSSVTALGEEFNLQMRLKQK